MSISTDLSASSASNVAQGAVASDVRVELLKKAIDLQALAALALLQSAVQQPVLATNGSLGTQLNKQT